jgi:hypothetical protein
MTDHRTLSYCACGHPDWFHVSNIGKCTMSDTRCGCGEFAAREAPADAPPATPTPGLDRACLNCEGHGVIRTYLNRAGDYNKSHCPNCAGTGRQRLNVPPAPTGERE